MHWFLGVVTIGELRRFLLDVDKSRVEGVDVLQSKQNIFIYVLDSLLPSVDVAKKKQNAHLQILVR